MKRHGFSTHDVELLVEEAVAGIPDDLRRLLENVVIVLEEEPAEDDLDSPGDEDSELLGIFRGIPRSQWQSDLPAGPSTIAIFRGPILRCCRSRKDAVDQIRETVIHEIGHYFGLGDDEMVY